MGAALLSMPQLELREDQAERLAKALAEYGRYHTLPALSPEKTALAVLVWTAGTIYVPMALAVINRNETVMPAAPDMPAPIVQPGPPSWFGQPAS